MQMLELGLRQRRSAVDVGTREVDPAQRHHLLYASFGQVEASFAAPARLLQVRGEASMPMQSLLPKRIVGNEHYAGIDSRADRYLCGIFCLTSVFFGSRVLRKAEQAVSDDEIERVHLVMIKAVLFGVF
jgi:hypothetical protein